MKILYQHGEKTVPGNVERGNPFACWEFGLRNWLEAEEPEQLSLFDLGEENEKQKRLNEAMDSIRSRFGEGAIQRGVYWKKDGRKEL